ncbi:hypothetical protein [Paenibacillus dendritiformis]|uniref:hypothetical protein n=1 Tax=Paenibacillus dendritiformis TaxID=130049 RepID=UPI00387E047C
MQGYKPHQVSPKLNSRIQTASKKPLIFLELGEFDEGGEEKVEKGKNPINTNNPRIK